MSNCSKYVLIKCMLCFPRHTRYECDIKGTSTIKVFVMVEYCLHKVRIDYIRGAVTYVEFWRPMFR